MSKTVEEYMKLPYRMEIYPDAVEGGYTVAFPDLPGCLTCGETMEKAIENSEDAKRCWFEAAIEDGVQIKEPDDLIDYSGEVTIKMPKSLHRALSEQSRRENVTISKYCTYLLSRDNTLYVTDNTDECLKMPTRKKAFQEGYKQGYANSMAKRVLCELGSKGKVPENLYDRIMAETDVDVLDRWDELARNASSIKEFEKAEYNDQRIKGTNMWFSVEDILQMGRRQGMLDAFVLRYRKDLGSKKGIIVDALEHNLLKEFLEKLVQHGQIDTLLDMYRDNTITTNVLVERAEAGGIREDMIDRISEEETPELAQKFFNEWKPDFTKLTFREKKRIEAAEADKETTLHEDVN